LNGHPRVGKIYRVRGGFGPSNLVQSMSYQVHDTDYGAMNMPVEGATCFRAKSTCAGCLDAQWGGPRWFWDDFEPLPCDGVFEYPACKPQCTRPSGWPDAHPKTLVDFTYKVKGLCYRTKDECSGCFEWGPLRGNLDDPTWLYPHRIELVPCEQYSYPAALGTDKYLAAWCNLHHAGRHHNTPGEPLVARYDWSDWYANSAHWNANARKEWRCYKQSVLDARGRHHRLGTGYEPVSNWPDPTTHLAAELSYHNPMANCRAPRRYWRFASLPTWPMHTAGAHYGAPVTQEACWRACGADPGCLQAVYHIRGQVCFPMSAHSFDDQDALGGWNVNWASIHCNMGAVTTYRNCDNVYGNWRFTWLGLQVEIHLANGALMYGSATTQERCFRECSKQPTCKQAVFHRPTGICYPMNTATWTDADAIGGQNREWDSIHCNLT